MSKIDKRRKYNYKIDRQFFGESNMQVITSAAETIKEVWSYQHPVIHTWFLLSSISMCFFFAYMLFAM